MKSIDEMNSREYEDMVDFMRADMDNQMGYTKLIEAARKRIEERGGDFYEKFEQWKKENGHR